MTNNIYEVKKVNHPHDIFLKVPGSKSITNRALLIAALAKGKSVLKGVLFSDDSRHFMQALMDLGFEVSIDEENQIVEIVGCGGDVPCVINSHDTTFALTDVDATVYVGSAGTAARFITAFLGLSKGSFRVTASEQMKKRPMKELLVALEEMGSQIIYEEEPYRFPFIIGNFQPKKNEVCIDVEKSSQFLSALLISAVLLPEDFSIYIKGNHGMAYVNMTLNMMKQFGVTVENTKDNGYRRTINQDGLDILKGKDNAVQRGYQAMDYLIEPDVSAACYFYALSPLLNVSVQVKNVHLNCLQGDIQFLEVLDRMGCSLKDETDGVILSPPIEGLLGGFFDLSSFSDQALTLAAIAPFASSKVSIMNVGHIRYQECDRMNAIVENLKAMGILVNCEDNNLFILPGKVKGCEIETFEDHRVAMAFSLPGVLTDGIKIKNPSCTRKTFENYFEVLEETVY